MFRDLLKAYIEDNLNFNNVYLPNELFKYVQKVENMKCKNDLNQTKKENDFVENKELDISP